MPDCTARAAGMRIIQTVDASASGATLTARETKFVCGGPNDGDGYFLAVGKPEKFHFAAGASASVLNGIHSKQVSVAELLRFVHKCAGSGAGTVQYPSSCNGQFAITVNKAGKITAVKQRYHS
ncbi:hypothetical protein [Kitasatospora sp. MAP5-34]|uniref:hypothetical protein n=1 Tax=Kitasatospora sp. MAP5-34 TaxID=3035102 RepID=UPI002472F659|nr:hypothetical protein [Kitasatospora sp. MAP5-34]